MATGGALFEEALQDPFTRARVGRCQQAVEEPVEPGVGGSLTRSTLRSKDGVTAEPLDVAQGALGKRPTSNPLAGLNE